MSVYETLSPSTVGRLRVLNANGLRLELDGLRVWVSDRPIQLPLKEFALLKILMENAGRVLSRRQLLDEVWSDTYPDENKTLDTHIGRLRRRLGSDGQPATVIRTVRGVGYVFDLPDRPLPDR